MYAFGRRHLTAQIGLLAALLFASTPLVLWEAGTAYADLAPTFFGTLTLLAVANGMAGRDERWLRLGAVLMGLTLSTKATSLTTLALLAAGLLFWRLRLLKQKPAAGGRGAGRLVPAGPGRRLALVCQVRRLHGQPGLSVLLQNFRRARLQRGPGGAV